MRSQTVTGRDETPEPQPMTFPAGEPPSPDQPTTLFWPFAGGKIQDIGENGSCVATRLAPAGADEVVARVDAVCVCSSDVKIIRMGAKHPLFKARDLAISPVVLGHEVALTVVDVGQNWRDLYQVGQRLGLQPAMVIDGRRITIGMDSPGGFSQHMRLDRRMLDAANPYVFPIPGHLSAAEVALLEPYSCVEAAYRQNCRIAPKEGGSMLIVGFTGGEAATLNHDCRPARVALVDAPTALEAWAREHAGQVEEIAPLQLLGREETFDDIIVCGAAPPADLATLAQRLAVGGLFALVSREADNAAVAIDVARIHYHCLSFVGAPGPEVQAAFASTRNRFEFRSGGTALILGAGGAMGRMHLHRALYLKGGPDHVVATSRQGERLEALKTDFAPLARHRGKRLTVLDDKALAEFAASEAPQGFDDVAVVAPDVAAVMRGAALMREDGMLVVFSGMPFGETGHLPLGLIARAGARFTGSTGSLVDDQLAVLRRVEEDGLDLTVNLEVVAGFGALPSALEAVMEGRVSGKVAIYPGALDAPLTPLRTLRSDEGVWSIDAERRFTDAGVKQVRE